MSLRLRTRYLDSGDWRAEARGRRATQARQFDRTQFVERSIDAGRVRAATGQVCRAYKRRCQE